MKLATKKELIARWDNLKTVNLPDSPFGVTEEGHSDFRGMPFLRRFEIKLFTLENCDFSYADFTERWIEATKFRHCVFRGTKMDGISDRHNDFLHCSFIETSFRKAALGISTTNFENCLFEKCNFTDTLFSNPVFKRVRFIHNKIKTLDFQASGFWDCSFIGEINDVTFRGHYLYKNQREKHPFPQETGLHNVDFSEAELMWICTSHNCAVENVKMPKDGSAFICDSRPLFGLLDTMVQPQFSAEEWKKTETFFKIMGRFNDNQIRLILTRHGMIDACGKVVGAKLYEILKSRFTLQE